MLTELLHNILKSRVCDVARETPLDLAPRLSRRLSNEVLLKREDLQPVFSFKLRGAYNNHLDVGPQHLQVTGDPGKEPAPAEGHEDYRQAILAVTEDLGANGALPRNDQRIVERMDEGQAGLRHQCVAVRLGIGVAVAGQHHLGAHRAHRIDLDLRRGLRHDDGRVQAELPGGKRDTLRVIAGAGGDDPARPFVLAQVRNLRVEPFEAGAMYQSPAAGRRVRLDHVGMFADGVAMREVGEITFPIVRHTVDEIVRVSNDEICAAIKDIFDDTRTIMEPAGALAAAGLKAWAERAEVGEAREALLAVTIPERPGAFREFCAAIGRRVVTEFNYRLSGRRQAHIFVGIATQSRQDSAALAVLLNARGYETADLTDNETAKLHVRHMVGGHAPDVRHERLCRFEFPERPGALTEFLDKLGGRWNISLFHYRNHGADFGRVLAGFEVEEPDLPAFCAFLSALGYPYTPEHDNPAYTFFLGPPGASVGRS